MRRAVSLSAAVIAAGLLTGCISNPPIAFSSDLVARTEAVEVAGIGGSSKGTFRVGQSQGRFSRSADHVKIDDLHQRNIGGAHFEAIGPDFSGTASGDCNFDEGQLDWGVATFSEKRLTYTCAFRLNDRIDGPLVLAEVPSGKGALAGVTRAGELRIDGTTMTVKAVHQFRENRVRSGQPLGYIFSMSGREVGAVDLAGRKTVYLPREPGPERRAVLMAGVALLLFWDPGE